MKYGMYVAYWLNEWGADYKKYIDKAAAMGFDVLEISCASFNREYDSDAKLDALKAYADEKGVLFTAGYGPTAAQNISSADPETVKNALAFFKALMPKLHRLGIDQLGGGLYSYWPVDYTKPVDKPGDWKRAVLNMKIVADHAAEYGINLNMEVLNRFEGYLLNTCEEAVRFVEEVNKPNVRIMLDTFHMNIEEDNIGQAIRRAGAKLGHVHLGEANRKVPGKGSMPWNEIGCALRDIKYDRAVVMEPFVMQGGTIGSEIKVWRDLVSDASEAALDHDAQYALHFVRQVFEA